MIIVPVAVLFCGNVSAHNSIAPSSPDTEKQVKFYFRGGSAALERDYLSNAASLNSLDAILLRASFIAKTDSLTVAAGASPDGDYRRNESLARNRAEAIKSYIAYMCPELDADKIKVHYRVTSWNELKPLVEADSLSPYRTRVLAAMSEKYSPAQTEYWIKQIDRGRAWAYVKDNYLSRFRSGDASIVFYYEGKSVTLDEAVIIEREEQQKEIISEVIETPPADTVEVVQTPVVVEQPEVVVLPVESAQKQWIPLVAIKTDLMLWAGVMPGFIAGTWTPNISAEVFFARNWSVQAGWAYSDWNRYAGSKRLFAVSGFDIEGRYWFKSDYTYSGLFVSANMLGGDYDRQQELTGQTGTFWGAGAGAGYMLPLSRNWGFEAQVRLGYLQACNESYDIEPGHFYIDSKQTSGKFNPQVRVQVVYRFGKNRK